MTQDDDKTYGYQDADVWPLATSVEDDRQLPGDRRRDGVVTTGVPAEG